MKPIRAEVESLLLRGYFNARVSGFWAWFNFG